MSENKFNWADFNKCGEYQSDEEKDYYSNKSDEESLSKKERKESDEIVSFSDSEDYAPEASPHEGVSRILNMLRYPCSCSLEDRKSLGRWCWGGLHYRGRYRVDTDGSIMIGESGGPKAGGCGAVARNANVQVIAASSRVSPKGPVSIIYHKLEGVKEGLELAKINQLSNFYLATDSYHVYEFLQRKHNRMSYQRKDRNEVFKILEEIDEMLEEVQSNSRINIICSRKGSNLAASYLSKLFEEVKVSAHDNSAAASPDEMKELISHKFGKKLITILNFDATGKNWSKAGRARVPDDGI